MTSPVMCVTRAFEKFMHVGGWGCVQAKLLSAIYAAPFLCCCGVLPLVLLLDLSACVCVCVLLRIDNRHLSSVGACCAGSAVCVVLFRCIEGLTAGVLPGLWWLAASSTDTGAHAYTWGEREGGLVCLYVVWNWGAGALKEPCRPGLGC